LIIVGGKKRVLKAHRVAWALSTGVWPRDQIDHINHNKTDNRLVNLREASHSDNIRWSWEYRKKLARDANQTS
jgi:hypothetical protein